MVTVWIAKFYFAWSAHGFFMRIFKISIIIMDIIVPPLWAPLIRRFCNLQSAKNMTKDSKHMGIETQK